MTLTFGGVRMAEGRAFTVGDGASGRETDVGKSYFINPEDGRRIVVEAVEYQKIRPMLTNLPPARPDGGRSAAIHRRRVLPIQRMAAVVNPEKRIQTAAFTLDSSTFSPLAFVLDYETVSGTLNNYVFAGNVTYLVAAGATVTLTGTTVVEGGSCIKYGAGAVLDVTGSINFRTSRWQPAVFTCRNDDTVGEAMSIGSPTQMGMLKLNSSTISGTIKHVQFRYATEAVRVLAGTPEFRHVQFVSCTKAFTFDQTASVYVGNALFHNITYVFDNDTQLTGEHITLNNCFFLGMGSGTYQFRNSVFDVDYTVSAPASSHNAFLGVTPFGTSSVTLSAPAFQTVGAGANYLAAGSLALNAGTTAINAGLLKEITERTTYPPQHRNGGSYYTDWVVSPSVSRDYDGKPDCGYHYEPLDWLATGISMYSSAKIIVTNGAALGIQFNGGAGISLQDFAQFISQGTATSQNFVGRAHLVQEQPSSATAGWMPIVTSSSSYSSIRYRHTILPALAGGHHYFYGGAQGALEFSHCDLKCGQIWYGQSSAYTRQIVLTNNLFFRTTLTLGASDQNVTLYAYNNLFVGGTLSLNPNTYNAWLVKDCVFDKTSLSQSIYSLSGASHNGYVSGYSRLSPQQSSDRVVSAINYNFGQRGELFVSDTTSFENNGSRTVESAGLRHFTVRTDQQKDSGTVDIGLHHVARDAALWTPKDEDADAVADIIEDANGNGAQEIGETSWTRQDSPFVRRQEPLGPSSRRTPLVISEIMYNPNGSQDNEFIELYNSHHLPANLSGFQLRFDTVTRFTFPANTILAANAFLIVARNPNNYSQVPNRYGPYTPSTASLSDSARIQLVNVQGAILLDVEYDDDPPWPVQADGAGHSLILANPSYGENDPRAWAASRLRLGSPGGAETNPADLLNAIKINEFLANPPDGQEDFIELYNACNQSVDISGRYLSDTAGSLLLFPIPAGTVLTPRGFIHFVRNAPGSLFTFGLVPSGEQIFLSNPQQTRVLDAVRFAGQEQGISTGRAPDGAPAFNELVTRTPGTANSPALTRNIVISEIMFNPISGDDNHEYIELYNRGLTPQSLLGWGLRGVDFPNPNSPNGFANFNLQPGAYLVVARDQTILAARYPGQLTANVNLFGNYSGVLKNSGDRIALVNSAGVVVDEVMYRDGGRWGKWSDAGGASLSLRDFDGDNRLAGNWTDSTPPANNPAVTVQAIGPLELGDPNLADALEISLSGAGESLIDNVQVIPQGSGNRVINGDFSNGDGGWFFDGNHYLSSVVNGWLQVRTENRGDYLGNRIRTTWTPAIANGVQTTLRTDVRWQRGSTNLLLRLKGNHLELAASVDPPTNLGTPGNPNVGVAGNVGPAIYDVQHWPAVPNAGELVTVTARLHDPNGVASAVVRYRVDPSSTTTDVTLRDDGTQGDALAGDGQYTAVIPAQTAGTLVAFQARATDGLNVTTLFPSDAPARECLVRFGDPAGAGSLGEYRLWMTAATATAWATRTSAQINNHALDVTFVYGRERVIYNAGAAFSGSDNTASTFTTPTGVLCGYGLDFPTDERFLGADEAALDWPIQDPSGQREQVGYWLAQQLGLPFSHRRFIHLYVNGVGAAQRPNVNGYLTAHVYEDVQGIDADFLEEWYSADPDGDLFKLQVWRQGSSWPPQYTTLQHARLFSVINSAQQKHLPSYRWNWRKRAARDSVNDYSRLYTLVDAVHDTVNYVQSVENLADVEQWMRVFAVERMIGNIDTYSRYNGHNMFAYKPTSGSWKLLLFDIDLAMGVSPGPTDSTDTGLFDGPVEDPKILDMLQTPAFQRAYWRAFRDAVNGPMLEANYGPVATAAYNLLINAGIKQAQNGTADVAMPSDFSGWLNGRRDYISSQLQTVASPFEINNNGGNDFPTSSATVVLTGGAPVEVKTIRVNGATVTVTWPLVTTWNITLALQVGANNISIQGYDRNANPLSGFTDSIVITRQ